MFSWGCSKDGRLGMDAGDEGKHVCLPKPIFGSLHFVSDMCCRGWNSIIIAEQILDSKPVRSMSYLDYLRKESSSSSSSYDVNAQFAHNQDQELFGRLEHVAVGSPCGEKAFVEQQQQKQFSAGCGDNSEVPEWLKRDFNDASVIHIDALLNKKEEPQMPPSDDNATKDFKVTLKGESNH